ncbi:hypothetical protein [Streptomyces sp. NPDC002156]
MPEGGEQYKPPSEEQQPETVQRLPIESVQTRELADQNLVAYVTGEIARMAQEQGTPEERAAKLPKVRTTEGYLYHDLYDVGVGLRNHGLQTGETPAAYQDVQAARCAYALLAYSRLSPDLEQWEAIGTVWPDLRERGTDKEPGVSSAPGIRLTERQAELVSAVAQQAGIAYDRSERFVSAAPAFAAWGRSAETPPTSH